MATLALITIAISAFFLLFNLSESYRESAMAHAAAYALAQADQSAIEEKEYLETTRRDGTAWSALVSALDNAQAVSSIERGTSRFMQMIRKQGKRLRDEKRKAREQREKNAQALEANLAILASENLYSGIEVADTTDSVSRETRNADQTDFEIDMVVMAVRTMRQDVGGPARVRDHINLESWDTRRTRNALRRAVTAGRLSKVQGGFTLP